MKQAENHEFVWRKRVLILLAGGGLIVLSVVTAFALGCACLVTNGLRGLATGPALLTYFTLVGAWLLGCYLGSRGLR